MAGASMMLKGWKDTVKAAADLGYDVVEIFLEYPQTELDQVSPAEREQAKKLAQELKVGVAGHAPFNSLNLAAFNRGIREESVRQSMEAVRFISDLGGDTVIIHNGDYVIDAAWGPAAETGIGIQWDLNLDSLKRVAAVAEERGVYLCLENCNFVGNKIERNLDDLLEIKNEVANPSLKFNLDIGHSRLAEGVPNAIKALGEDIRHIHFTDNFGRNDDHLIIGTGNFDYQPFLYFIRKFPYIVTLEAIKIDTSLDAAKKSLENFRKIIQSP
jgi:sugar phosphate isomerase/epimerase